MKRFPFAIASTLFFAVICSGCKQDDCVAATVTSSPIAGCTDLLEIQSGQGTQILEVQNLTDFVDSVFVGQVFCIEYDEVDPASFCQIGPVVRLTSLE